MKANLFTVSLLSLMTLSERLHGSVILQFESPRNERLDSGGAVTSIYEVEESDFVLKSRPLWQQWGGGLTFRDPSPGILNWNGLNTVPYNGSSYAAPFAGDVPVLRQKSGMAFQLLSVDLAPFSASFSGQNVFTISGSFTTGGYITKEVVWDVQVQGQATDFHTIEFDEQWNNLLWVSLAARGPGGGGALSVDNIAVSVIPEPSSSVLVCVGMIGLLAVRRRRSS